MTIPVIPPLPPEFPVLPTEPNPIVAQCGECLRYIRAIEYYSCPNVRCPVQPRVIM